MLASCLGWSDQITKGWTKMVNFADLDAMDDAEWDKVFDYILI
jgi:hypothetical protein